MRTATSFRRALLILGGLASYGCAAATTQHRNKAIVRGYMEGVLNRGDTAAVSRYFPPGGLMFNGRLLQPGDMLGMRQALLARFPDFRLVIEDQVAEGDRVVTRVTFHGTHLGASYGIEPTGRRIAYQGIAIDRVVNGRVVEAWHQADQLALLRQLGVTRVP